MGRVSDGGGGDGEVLNTEQKETLKHVRYDEETDSVIVNRPLHAGLNSFILGQKFIFSSAGSDISFKDIPAVTNYYPLWGGIKDQSVVANQDATGIIPPFALNYSTGYAQAEPNGPVGTGSIAHTALDNVASPVAIFSNEMILEQAVSSADYLFYRVYEGTDNTGVEVYSQILTGLTLSIGDPLVWDFTHPIRMHEGSIYAEITISVGSRDNIKVPLLVRRGVADTNVRYAKIGYRLLVRDEVVLDSMLGDFELAVSESLTDSIHMKDGQLIIWTDGQYIQWV